MSYKRIATDVKLEIAGFRESIYGEDIKSCKVHLNRDWSGQTLPERRGFARSTGDFSYLFILKPF